MAPDLKPVLRWFGFSRQERRSTFILLIILLLLIAIRYTFPERDNTFEDLSASLSSPGGIVQNDVDEIRDTGNTFIPDRRNNVYDSLNYPSQPALKGRTVKKNRYKGAGFAKVSGSPGNNISDKNPSAGVIRYTKERKYYVPGEESKQVQSKLIDLNRCDSVLLDALPGIGPVLSARIVKYRNLLGGFISREQLKEVYGLSQETYNMVADRVFADSTMVKRIDINNAGFKDLIRHPYFDRYDVQAVLKFRELKGKILNMMELTDNKVLTFEKARKTGPYLSFGN